MVINNSFTVSQRRYHKRNWKISKTSESENTARQDLPDVAKAVLRGKFVALSVYITKKKKQINNITSYLKELEKKGRGETN